MTRRETNFLPTARGIGDNITHKFVLDYLPERRDCVMISRIGWLLMIKFENKLMTRDKYVAYLPFIYEGLYEPRIKLV